MAGDNRLYETANNVFYAAENIFVLCKPNGQVEDLLFLRLERGQLIARSFINNPYVDNVVNGASDSSKKLIFDLLTRRIIINKFLKDTFLGEKESDKSLYDREYYDLETIIMMHRAFVNRFNGFDIVTRTLLDNLSRQACLEWKKLIRFTDAYDEEFLVTNPEYTTITDINSKAESMPITEEQKEKFFLYLLFEIRLRLYMVGNNCWNFVESTTAPNCLRKAALLTGVKGYVYNSITMRFKDQKIRFYLGSISVNPYELKEKVELLVSEKNR